MTTSNRLPRTFVATVSLASFSVFLQAVTAGMFVNQEGHDSWVSVHGVIADVTWVSALVAAIVGLARVRRSRPSLAYGATVLFLIALAQTGLGHLITDKGMDWLIVVHVPVAVVLFGLAVWLLIGVARAHRVLPDVVDPYVDEAPEPLTLANRR